MNIILADLFLCPQLAKLYLGSATTRVVFNLSPLLRHFITAMLF